MRMPNDQYWAWFWTDVHWRLIIGLPIFVIAAAYTIWRQWYDDIYMADPKHDKPLDSDITKLNLNGR